MIKNFFGANNESDEELVQKYLKNIDQNEDIENSISDLKPLVGQFKKQVSMHIQSILRAFSSNITNNNIVEGILVILIFLLKETNSDSVSNTEFMIGDKASFEAFCECLKSDNENRKRGSLSIFKRLSELAPEPLKQLFFNNASFQSSLIGLSNTNNPQLYRNLFPLIRTLVNGNNEIKQMVMFQIIDHLIAKFSTEPQEVLETFESLVSGHLMNQKLFVGSGYLSHVYSQLKMNSKYAVSFLTVLFKSEEGPNFRKETIVKDIVRTVLSLVLSNTDNRVSVIRLLGYLIKGNHDLCAIMSNDFASLLRLIFSSEQEAEQESYYFLIECFLYQSSDYPSFLAHEIIKQPDTLSILQFYDSKVNLFMNIITLSRICILSDRTTQTLFLCSPTGDDIQCFGSLVINALISSQTIDSKQFRSILQFISVLIWESSSTVLFFINNMSKDLGNSKQNGLVLLVKLCQKDTPKFVRELSVIVLLECLLFKISGDPVFSQLVSFIKAHLPMPELKEVVFEMQKSILETHESLMKDFSLEAIRVVIKNFDILLSDQSAHQSESSQIISLKNKISELEKENSSLKNNLDDFQKLKEEFDEQDSEIQKLNQALQSYNDTLETKNEEIESLKKDNKIKDDLKDREHEIELLKKKILEYEEEKRIFVKESQIRQLNNNDEDVISLKHENDQLKEEMKALLIQQSISLNSQHDDNQNIDKEMDNRIKKLENQFEDCKLQVLKLENELEIKSKTISELEEDIIKFSEGTTNESTNIVTNQLEDSKLKMLELEKEIDECNLDISSKQDTINNQISNINEMMIEIESYKNQISRTDSEKISLINELEKEKKDGSEKIEALLKKIDEQNQKIQSLFDSNNYKDLAISEKDDLLVKISGYEIHITEMERKSEQFQNEKRMIIEQLQNDIKTKEQEIEKYHNDTHEKDRLITQLQKEISDLQKSLELASLESTKTITLMQKELNEEKSKEIDLSRTIQELNDQKVALENQNSHLLEENGNYQQIVLKLKETNKHLLQKERNIELEINQLRESQNMASDEKVGALIKEIGLHKAKISELMENIDESKDKNEGLQKQIDNLMYSNEQMNLKHIEDIKRLKGNNTNDINDLKSKYRSIWSSKKHEIHKLQAYINKSLRQNIQSFMNEWMEVLLEYKNVSKELSPKFMAKVSTNNEGNTSMKKYKVLYQKYKTQRQKFMELKNYLLNVEQEFEALKKKYSSALCLIGSMHKKLNM